jgi:hypothetical protein
MHFKVVANSSADGTVCKSTDDQPTDYLALKGLNYNICIVLEPLHIISELLFHLINYRSFS